MTHLDHQPPVLWFVIPLAPTTPLGTPSDEVPILVAPTDTCSYITCPPGVGTNSYQKNYLYPKKQHQLVSYIEDYSEIDARYISFILECKKGNESVISGNGMNRLFHTGGSRNDTAASQILLLLLLYHVITSTLLMVNTLYSNYSIDDNWDDNSTTTTVTR